MHLGVPKRVGISWVWSAWDHSKYYIGFKMFKYHVHIHPSVFTCDHGVQGGQNHDVSNLEQGASSTASRFRNIQTVSLKHLPFILHVPHVGHSWSSTIFLGFPVFSTFRRCVTSVALLISPMHLCIPQPSTWWQFYSPFIQISVISPLDRRLYRTLPDDIFSTRMWAERGKGFLVFVDLLG
jgi:hypothetical protein